MERISVGNVEVIAISDSTQAYPGASVYPQAGDELERYSAYLTADGAVEMNFGCYLLRADGATVLVDTGLGPESNGALMDELAAAGVSPDEVNTVIFTHLHGDHTGWNIDRESGKPNFPSARYLVPQKDWEHYAPAAPGGSFARDIAPLEDLGCLELIEPERRISASLVATPAPGHTPGHLGLAITSDGQKGFILGDAAISPIHVEEPDWQTGFDWDHDISRHTRNMLLDRLEAENALVAASHFPAPGLGRFVRVEGRRTWRAVEL